MKPPKPGEAKRKKLHWKSARKMEREAADLAAKDAAAAAKTPGRRQAANQEAEANSRGRLVAMPVL